MTMFRSEPAAGGMITMKRKGRPWSATVSWSFSIGRLFGSELRVHATFFLLLAWIGTAAWLASGPAEAAVNVVFVVALFACVVAHEFGHALVARRYGIRTPDITLLPIGGLARLERLPDDPRQEIAVAVAGPLVNVAIWAVLALVVLGGSRELIGQGTLFDGAHLMFGETARAWRWTLSEDYPGILIAILPPGAFIGLGMLIAIMPEIQAPTMAKNSPSTSTPPSPTMAPILGWKPNSNPASAPVAPPATNPRPTPCNRSDRCSRLATCRRPRLTPSFARKWI